MKLYLFPAGRAVGVLALKNHLALDCEVQLLDFRRGDQLTPQYLALNPNKKMPTLEDHGFVLRESNAILFYMAAKHPEKGLWPSVERPGGCSALAGMGKRALGCRVMRHGSRTRKPRKLCSVLVLPTPLSLSAGSRNSPASRPCSITRSQAKLGSSASDSRSRIFRSGGSCLQRNIWGFLSGNIPKFPAGTNGSLYCRVGPNTTRLMSRPFWHICVCQSIGCARVQP
jgi:hypothetical protein